MQDQIKKFAIIGAGHLLLKRFLLAVGVVACALVSLPVMADTIFPSDSQNLNEAGVAELLQAVCPGHVNGSDCPCPESSAFSDLTMSVNAITGGHFLSPSSEDAVVSTDGCEGTLKENGGTTLLTRRSRKWSVVWYRGGLITSRCHRIRLGDRREILVCIDEFDFRGANSITLYTEDLRNPFANGDRLTPAGSATEFFWLVDNRRCCGPSWEPPSVGEPLTWGSIEKVAFRVGPPAISVTATFGKGVWTAEEREAREGDADAFEKLLPPPKALPY